MPRLPRLPWLRLLLPLCLLWQQQLLLPLLLHSPLHCLLPLPLLQRRQQQLRRQWRWQLLQRRRLLKQRQRLHEKKAVAARERRERLAGRVLVLAPPRLGFAHEC